MLMYERQRCEFRVVLQKRARRLQERKVDDLQRTKELYQVYFSSGLQFIDDVSKSNVFQVNNLMIKLLKRKFIEDSLLELHRSTLLVSRN